MFKHTLLLFLLSCLSLSAFAQSKYTISGHIKDGANGEELIGATIYVEELKTGTTTNVYGFYSLTLPAGTYSVTVQYIGFDLRTDTIKLDQNITLNIEMKSQSKAIDVVEVTGERMNKNVEDVNMGVVKMDIKTIKKIPAVFGEVDIIKSLQLLPGIVGAGEGVGGFFVRGGGVDQNLILLDEAVVYNASHLLGFFSVFNPDDHTHVEIVKFPDGSDAMVRLSTLATGEGQPLIRTAKMIGNILTKPVAMFKLLFTRNLPRTSIIFLVMQTLDNSMKMVWKRGWFGGGSMAIDNSGQAKVPAYIPIGQEVMNRYAEKTGGVAMNSVMEVMFNMSSTAHILGGCPMGETTEQGVVNERFEVHGYPNMYILDGSIIPCNLGVNPSLTITALSEYAMAQVPSKEGNENVPLERRMVS